ncbi:MAG: GTP 3',8-cyclase MoaA [Candidatus Omnitrophica bacterium]|nr:GTP 3',8-cyclase MoaA [Candidatus Omnitrophota bacterium]
MQDQFGRNITYLRVSLIDRCNLRCFYCMPQGFSNPFKEDELLALEEVFEIVSLFQELGVRKVRLTGGEPLLRKGVPELVAKIKSLPGIREVVMTSNGVLLNAFAARLKQAGLDRINVSLDTLSPETFRRITGLDKLKDVLDGIEAAVACGIAPIKINAVLMKGWNDHEVTALAAFAVERGMEVRFIEWMPTAADIRAVREDRFLSVDFARRKIEEAYGLIPDLSEPFAPARSFFIQGTRSKVGFISPLSNAFCPMCNRVRLRANGMLKTCLHGKEDLDIRTLLRSGCPRERIKREILHTVWRRPEEHFLNNASVPHNDFVMTAVGG